MGSFDGVKGAGAALNATTITSASGIKRTAERKSVDVKFGGSVSSFEETSFSSKSVAYSAAGNPFSAEYSDSIADALRSRSGSDRKEFMMKFLSQGLS